MSHFSMSSKLQVKRETFDGLATILCIHFVFQDDRFPVPRAKFGPDDK